MSWALKGGEIEKLDYDEELDYLEIRLQKLESKDFTVRRKSAEALAPYIADNRYLDEVRTRFKVQPPHPAQVIADGILGPNSEKNSCTTGAQSLAHMGPAAAPYASHALGVLMSHTDEDLRWEAARALGCLGEGAAKAAAHMMAKQLDPDNETAVLVRFQTAQSLGLMGPGAAEGAAKALAKAMEDPDTNVRNLAVVSLGLIGPEAAQYATKAVVRQMLEGTFEMRRLAAQALLLMGPACAGEAAFPCSRVLLSTAPCCRKHHHPLVGRKKRPPHQCNKCLAIGPFAHGTDYSCAMGCKWDICRECYCKFMHNDVKLQRLAAEALCAMGPKAIQTCQVYLARALGDKDEEIRAAAKRALESAGCEKALSGSMGLYDRHCDPCGDPACKLCKVHIEETLLLMDEQQTGDEDGDDVTSRDDGSPTAKVEEEASDSDFGKEEAPRQSNVVEEETRRDPFDVLEEEEEAPRDEEEPRQTNAVEHEEEKPMSEPPMSARSDPPPMSEPAMSEAKPESAMSEAQKSQASVEENFPQAPKRRDPWGPEEQPNPSDSGSLGGSSLAASRQGSKRSVRPSLVVDTFQADRATKPMTPEVE